MSKILSENQIRDLAKQFNVEYAAVRAVLEVESSGSGFAADGNPTILFEPHIFWKELDKKNYKSLKLKMQAIEPTLLYPKWRTYPYGPSSKQWVRMQTAANLVFKALPALNVCNTNDAKIASDVQEAAWCSASWGLGQVMGFHWEALGYASIYEFVEKMRESEANQLDCMLRFCKMNNLIPKLQTYDWAGFARGYNGANYAVNNYDQKLKAAYNKFKGK